MTPLGAVVLVVFAAPLIFGWGWFLALGVCRVLDAVAARRAEPSSTTGFVTAQGSALGRTISQGRG